MKAQLHPTKILLILLFGWGLGLAFASAQSVEFNVKVKEGSRSEQFLNSRAGNVDPGLMRDLRQVPHLEGLLRVESLGAQSAPRKTPVEGIFTLRLDAVQAVDVQSRLLASGDFEWVEPNRLRPLHLPAAAPNDTRVAEQWYHANIRTFEAWDSTRGNGSVVVGVLDTGLDFDHPEFEGQVAINAAEDINGNGRFDYWPDSVQIGGVSGDLDGIDQDGNGYADDVAGYDFTDQPRSPFGGDYLGPDPVPLDDNNHGTLVSGIIVARADNQYGGAGIAPGCKVKVLRAFSANGSGEDDDVARAIVYAADNGVKILNFSFGDIYPSQTMHAAIRYAYSKGVVMLASSGNGTGDNLHYPSGFDEVISVGASAVTSTGEEVLWPLSSFGHTLSLVAPGSGILCPVVRDTLQDTEDFDTFSGTSCSAPMVSAAVALLFSQRGECSPQQVRGLLTSTADDISNEGWDHYTGAGRLNILRLLQQMAASNVQILAPGNDSGTSADSLWVVVSALDPLGESIHLEYQAGLEGFGEWLPIVEDVTTQIWNDTLALWHVQNLPEGEYTLRLRVEKTNGTTAEDRVRIVIDRTPPVVDVRISAPAWDNAARKHLVVFRNSDRGLTQLHVRALGSTDWRTLAHDRITRNGYFLLGEDILRDGSFEMRLTCTNEADLTATSSLDTIVFASNHITDFGYGFTGSSIPMGHYLQSVHDLDNDGLLEVVMSRYTENLGFGPLMRYEYNAVAFTLVDSITFKPVLIPKYLGDADGDGMQELLCSVNDSAYIFKQTMPLVFPTQRIYSNEGQGLYAATLADTDNDLDSELILKDAVNYRVFEYAANTFSQAAVLPDQTGGYIGSVAPNAIVKDLDGDGKADILTGDYDGDLQVYEHDGTAYQLVWKDSTTFERSSDYLAAGDFNGNGKQEFFVAVHASLLRNEVDFEYEAPVWWLRIFESTGDNTYQVVWEDHLFDIDTDGYNAVTAADLDADTQEELIFSTFPRTYVIDHDGSGYKMDWFHYGALCTHHVVADFNQDGVAEFALGRGDTAFFVQKDLGYSGPGVVAQLTGHVPASQTCALNWSAVGNAVRYRVWRGTYTGPGSVQIFLIDSTTSTSYLDAGLNNGETYLYVVESVNPALSPAYSPFSYAVLLSPKQPGRIDSAWVVSPNQVMLRFSVEVAPSEENLFQFKLDSGGVVPVSLVGGTGGTREVLLAFAEPLEAGAHFVRVDSVFLDAGLARLDSAGLKVDFVFDPDSTGWAYFTKWRVVDPSTAEITFNREMSADVLTASHWTVRPFGSVAEVRFSGSGANNIRVKLQGCALGSLGYPVSLTLEEGTAVDSSKIREKEGNTATFGSHQDDLSGVYVYPNPFRGNDVFEGVRFANLTRTATVMVLSASGQKVISLQETDGDGGLEWNLLDERGERVRPGVYLFKVESEGVEGFLGKFSILE